MSDACVTRRQLVVCGAAGLIGAAGLGGGALVGRARAAASPYPLAAGGRLTPRALADYDDAMLSGGPGKDGIPAIDNPQFWTPDEADDYLHPNDVVFGVVAGGEARAYPQRILVWHEIVNDVVGGVGLAVTYCPLTGTAILFERGETEFGVSGRLVNSNLVMYDRGTDTWFPQVLAVGIRGPHAGQALVERPMVWTTWGSWRKAHPDTAVLSTRTGFARNYNRDPYGAYNPRSGYYAPDSGTIFPLMNRDDRHPPKSVFVGARTDNAAVAFRLETLRQDKQLTLEANGETFTAVHDEALDTGYIFRGAADGEVQVTGTGPDAVAWSNDAAPAPLNAFEAMWFAWLAFYPESAVHD